ncbi:hypothetical protein E2P81_ATG03828 [Venturia nashicola]|uniref:Uncharacterized protein n=1 Tax=Venturia nashicola TaxID=86259 RepID=A0A4Z1P9W9_9PEZI|nr:hypothetical protein E6O75_ATG03920 [Venturia nashicola]TLD38153.1 hypothetical protein E2P81_ATG03828 [Venturia nashicola]
MLFQNIAVVLSLAAVSTARVSRPQIREAGAICFDAGDCILTMATSMSWASCDHSGKNKYLLGLLGSCVTKDKGGAAPAASSAAPAAAPAADATAKKPA